MPKSIDKSKELIDKLLDIGLCPRSYSGRSMYGRECVAVVLSRDEGWSSWNIAMELANSDFDPGEPNEDAMGLGTVLYWPSYTWPDGMESE